MPSYQKLQEKIIVSFSGNMDTVTCIDFEEDLFKQINVGNDYVIFDLKDVGNISSMFLRVCTKTTKKTSKGKFSIVNVPETAMNVFKLTRLDHFFNISESCE